MSIKKWKDFKFKAKTLKVEPDNGIELKRNDKSELVDDLSNIQKNIDKLDKLKDGEYEIVSINDVSTEKPENIDEATIINADLGGKTVKRGDVIYITAMVKKKNVNWNSLSVFKCRITDMYNGTSILNTLK